MSVRVLAVVVTGLVLAGVCMLVPLFVVFPQSALGDPPPPVVISGTVRASAEVTSVRVDPRPCSRRPYSCQAEFSKSRSIPTGTFPKELDTIMYNRVPKCGSSIFSSVIKRLASQKGFSYVSSHIWTCPRLTETEQAEFVECVSQIPRPVMLDRHIHFVNFTSFGARQPVYINLIRDPIDRLQSFYYFRRYDHRRNMPIETRVRSYDECILVDDPECVEPQGEKFEEGYFKIIPYFCGQDDICSIPCDAALQMAKRNVEKYFKVVGYMEEITKFIEVLEQVSPHHFNGLLSLFNKAKQNDRFRTSAKLPLQAEVRRTLEKKAKYLYLEYEFYAFIQQRFTKQYKQYFGKT